MIPHASFLRRRDRDVRTRGHPDEDAWGRIFWLLACLLPAFTAGCPVDWPLWEVVSSYSSATASGFHGIPRCPRVRFYLLISRKELGPSWNPLRRLSSMPDTPAAPECGDPQGLNDKFCERLRENSCFHPI